MEQLNRGAGGLRKGFPQRIQNFLAFIVQSRRNAISSLVAVDRIWPSALNIGDVPWRRRTRNCLLRVGMQRRLTDLQQITFGDLFAIPSMGALSVLDFACTLEATIDEYQLSLPASAEPTPGAPPSPKGESNFSKLLLSVLDEPWSDWISERDPRFAGLLPAESHGTLTERIDRLSSTPETRDGDFEALAEATSRVRDRIAELGVMSLEAVLREYLGALSGIRDKRLPAVLARLHWDGSENERTLEEAGKMVGVTRERIRQLQSKVLDRLPPHPVVMPALDTALTVLAANAPIDPSAAAELLKRDRISERAFHPRSLIAAAKACGRTPSLHIEKIRNHELVVLDPAQASAETTIRIAHALARTSGASNVLDVLAEAGGRYEVETTEEQVRQVLQRYGDVEFLDEQWFWCPSRSNDFLRTVSRKMLSVASPIEIVVLREGIRRAFKFRGISAARMWRMPKVPPRNVLAQYFRAHPDFVLGDGGMVRPARPLDYRSELAGVEQVMVTVLRASPTNVLDRAELLEGCSQRGVTPGSLWVFLSYSPVVERLGPSMWSLRGIRVDPAAVEAIRQANALRPRQKRVIDYGWTAEGLLWIAVRLPEDAQLQVFNIPTAVRRFVEGRDFSGQTEAGDPCGRIRVQEYGSCHGHSEFLRRAGADEGDILQVSFDLAKGVASLGLIDDESLDELSPTL
jgi:hypothetical protein